MLKVTDSNMMNVNGKPVALNTATGHQLIIDDECRRLVEAEMYIQDAIEYVASETRPEASGGFIVEEEMLNNTGGTGSIAGAPILQLPASLETTSQMFRTNEVSILQFIYLEN